MSVTLKFRSSRKAKRCPQTVKRLVQNGREESMNSAMADFHNPQSTIKLSCFLYEKL